NARSPERAVRTGNSWSFPPYSGLTRPFAQGKCFPRKALNFKGSRAVRKALPARQAGNETEMAGPAPFAKMNGIGNEIIVADMRGRADRVSPRAALTLAADAATHFDQIMAIHDARTPGTDNFIEILNADGSSAQA